MVVQLKKINIRNSDAFYSMKEKVAEILRGKISETEASEIMRSIILPKDTNSPLVNTQLDILRLSLSL